MSQKLVQFSYQLKKENQRKISSWILFFIFLCIFINVILSFFFYPVNQKSVSMIPDVPSNSFIMVSPAMKSMNRGDVVLMKPRNNLKFSKFHILCIKIVKLFTGQQINPDESALKPSTKSHLRRIVAIPGDTIYMRDYVLYIKPAGEKHFLTEFETTKKAYNVTFFTATSDWESDIGVKGAFGEVTLADDEYFVLADNRKSSDDSRLWGMVKKSDIAARALLCYFPFNKFRVY